MRISRTRNAILGACAGLLVGAAAYDIAYWVNAFRGAPLDQDISLYYLASQIGLSHGWSHIYDVGLQMHFYQRLGAHVAWNSLLLYATPPPAAWLMAPFTLLPPVMAYMAVVTASLIALVAGAFSVAPGPRRRQVLYVLAGLAWYPVIYSFRLGQVTVLIAVAVVVAWRLDRGGRPELAGIALALTAIKPQLAILVAPCLFLIGRRRLALAWASTLAALVVLSLFSLGASGLKQYLDILAQLHGMAYNRQFTLAGVLGLGPATVALEAAIVVLTLAAAYYQRHAGPERVIAIALVGGVLAAPYLHVDDFAVLLAAGWLFLRSEPPLWQRLWLIAVAGATELAWVLGPVPILVTLAVWFAFLLPRLRQQPEAARIAA